MKCGFLEVPYSVLRFTRVSHEGVIVMASNSGKAKLLQVFFSPAVVMMNRLDVTRKFALLGLMSLVAITVVAYGLFANLDKSIGFMQQELKGIELVNPLSRTIQILQQHRGLSSMLLGGDETIRDSRIAMEQDAIEAFKTMEEKLPPGLASREDLQHIRTDWKRLREEGLNWTMDENFAAHTRLIDQIQSFERVVADEYSLILDPELDTFYLIDTIINKLPHALEHLGQIRAYGTGILINKQASEPQKIEINILVSKLGDALDDLKANLDKTSRHNSARQKLIAETSGNIDDSVRQITSLVASDILSGHFAMSPNDFYRVSTAAIDKSYTQIYEALLPMAETLIKARIARAKNTLRNTVAIAFLLFLAASYFSIGICRAIIVNIRSIASSARAFAGGNLSERIDLGTHDELGQVGDSFNEMADGFGALLKASRENEARLHDLSMHLEERVKERTVELELAQRLTGSTLSRYKSLMQTSMDGIHVMDVQGNLVEANDAFCRMLGYTKKDMHGLNVADWSARESVEELREKFRELVGKNDMFEAVYRRKDGTLINVEISASGVELDGQSFIYASSRDITGRKQAEEEIHNLAFYDTLTKLPNRRLFLDRFGAALTASMRLNNFGAVLFIDMDRFKLINDTLGHNYGDLLLIEVASRIKACVREMDTVARLGGDEFVVLIECVSDDQEEASYKVGLVAEKIRESLARPYSLNGHEHNSSPSIGISLYCGNEEPVNELLQHADMAMYQAKESGRNTVRFFDPVMQNNVVARAAFVSDLRNAIAQRQLHLHYQLQVDNDNRPVGAEALLRWIHPQRGMVMPEQFLPVAEESTLILDISDWALETACRQLALWSANEKMRDLVLTVNISARQFAMPDFVDRVDSLLRAYRINPAHLKLELTENMALDNLKAAVEKMHALKGLGVCLSMDDFGVRYSSLSNLKQLPLDQVKLGRSFVRDVASDGNVALLVQSIIDMSSRCRVTVIAEGVENEAQLDSLKSRDCVAYQGFLFGNALSIEEFEQLLN